MWVDRRYVGPAVVARAGALHRLVRLAGTAGGEQKVQHVDKPQWHGKTAFRDTLIDMERYKGNVDTLKIVDNDIRYKQPTAVLTSLAPRKRLLNSSQRYFASRVVGQCPMLS